MLWEWEQELWEWEQDPQQTPRAPYSRRVHFPLPGDSIQPGQHPLPEPGKQTWGPTRRLWDTRA